MNKRYYHIMAAMVIAAAASGCNNFLDTRIDTDLTEEVVNTNRHRLWNLGNAMYTPMQNGFVSLDNNFFAAASDEAQRTQESGNAYVLTNGILNQDNVTELTPLFKQYYEGIRACNYFLDFAEKRGDELLRKDRDIVRDKTQYDKDVRNLGWYKAEVHAARAYYYSELIKRFGGLPIVEDYFSGDFNPGLAEHSSYEEVVEYIVSEVDGCLDQLQPDWLTHPDNVATNVGRFEKKSALAIKARTLLYAASPLHNPGNNTEKWVRAAKASHDLIAELNYTIPADRDYRDVFLGNAAALSEENIFVMRLQANSGPEKANYPISTPGGNSGVTPTHDLVEAYEYIGPGAPPSGISYENRDPRLQATIVVNGSTWNSREIDQSPGGSDDMSKANTSKTGYYLKKFLHDDINITQDASKEHVWVVYRYAEVLLNYAEAMLMAFDDPDRKGDIDGYNYTLSAREALTQVRESASTLLPPVITTDKGEFLAALKHERRIELAFEDHRYWDLLRWKDAATVLNRPVHGVKVSKNGADYAYQKVEVADRVFEQRNYFWPIPRTEVVNSNGTLNQNDGY